MFETNLRSFYNIRWEWERSKSWRAKTFFQILTIKIGESGELPWVSMLVLTVKCRWIPLKAGEGGSPGQGKMCHQLGQHQALNPLQIPSSSWIILIEILFSFSKYNSSFLPTSLRWVKELWGKVSLFIYVCVSACVLKPHPLSGDESQSRVSLSSRACCFWTPTPLSWAEQTMQSWQDHND